MVKEKKNINIKLNNFIAQIFTWGRQKTLHNVRKRLWIVWSSFFFYLHNKFQNFKSNTICNLLNFFAGNYIKNVSILVNLFTVTLLYMQKENQPTFNIKFYNIWTHNSLKTWQDVLLYMNHSLKNFKQIYANFTRQHSRCLSSFQFEKKLQV